jgi:hypothetical protein
MKRRGFDSAVDLRGSAEMTEKKPQAKEWWEYNGVRIHIVGITTKGLLSCEYKDGTMSVLRQGDHWKHLPDCNSFEWQPETFPQYYQPSFRSIDRAAFIRRDSPSCVVTVRKDGSEVLWSSDWAEESDGQKEITKSDAISRLDNSRGCDKAIEVTKSQEMDLIEKLQKRVDRLEATERRERAMGAVQ